MLLESASGRNARATDITKTPESQGRADSYPKQSTALDPQYESPNVSMPCIRTLITKKHNCSNELQQKPYCLFKFPPFRGLLEASSNLLLVKCGSLFLPESRGQTPDPFRSGALAAKSAGVRVYSREVRGCKHQ